MPSKIERAGLAPGPFGSFPARSLERQLETQLNRPRCAAISGFEIWTSGVALDEPKVVELLGVPVTVGVYSVLLRMRIVGAIRSGSSFQR